MHRHGDLEDLDPHVAEDKAKLLARIEEDSVKTKVLERPQTYVQDGLSSRQSTSSASRLEESMRSLANLQPPSNMDANFQGGWTYLEGGGGILVLKTLTTIL